MPLSHAEAVQLAIELVNAGRPAEAAPIIKQVLEEDPNNATAWAVRSYLVREQDVEKAIEAARQVLRLRPGDEHARAYLEYLLSVRPDTRVSEPQHIIETPVPQIVHQKSRFTWTTPRLVAAISGMVLLLLGLFGLIWILNHAPPGSAEITDLNTGGELPVAQVNMGIPTASIVPSPVIVLLDTPTPTSTPTALPTPTLLPTVDAVDYSEMIEDYQELLDETANRWDYDLGFTFIDLRTGQVISMNGDTRYHAMSTFKAPLAAFYYSLLDQGLIEEHGRDPTRLRNMLEDSDNPDTTCVFKQVGGIAPFNDWLAEQGFQREYNFVVKWSDWPCEDDGGYYVPEPDLRYSQGDQLLGLPGDNALLSCPISTIPCDKAFTSNDLAAFYARLYRGEILSWERRTQMMIYMERVNGESVFLNHLPSGHGAHIYVKGGVHRADSVFRVNFFHEAGIVETDYGAFVLVVFMQRNPDWPGTWAIAEAAKISYVYFTAAHSNDPQ
jgi:tetratricopeptide (TPR) repeat protein